MKKAPCLNCKDRFPGCHGSCSKEAYIAWEAEQEKARRGKIEYLKGKAIANLGRYLSAKDGKY